MEIADVGTIFTFWLPFLVAIGSLSLNFIQLIGYRRVRNKISVWAKDSKGMISSIVGIQENIKKKNGVCSKRRINWKCETSW